MKSLLFLLQALIAIDRRMMNVYRRLPNEFVLYSLAEPTWEGN